MLNQQGVDDMAKELIKGNGLNITTLSTIAVLIGLIAVKPEILPYAEAAHDHDIQKIVADTVDHSQTKASLRTFIKIETIAVGNLNAQILSRLCIPSEETCALEKALRNQAQDRLQTYQTELNAEKRKD